MSAFTSHCVPINKEKKTADAEINFTDLSFHKSQVVNYTKLKPVAT